MRLSRKKWGNMEYLLHNGEKVDIRVPEPDDAADLIALVKQADSETKFMSREPDEFQISLEKEKEILFNRILDECNTMFIAEFNHFVVGQCSVGRAKKGSRSAHRANLSFFLLKEYWGKGIAASMIRECIRWCKDHSFQQIELDVVKENERAVQLLTHFGFKIVGEMPNTFRYDAETYADAYLMVMML